jgi:hypothetical protein
LALVAQIGTDRPEAIGTVTVAFHEVALAPDGVLPADEPKQLSLGTAAGAPQKANFQEVQVKAVGVARQVVSIRYVRDLPPAGAPAPVAGR